VKDGVVTLTGNGPAAAKAEAEKIVKVPGVSKVVNQIVVRKN
jgi:osmotically-inducible protein OsmY